MSNIGSLDWKKWQIVTNSDEGKPYVHRMIAVEEVALEIGEISGFCLMNWKKCLGELRQLDRIIFYRKGKSTIFWLDRFPNYDIFQVILRRPGWKTDSAFFLEDYLLKIFSIFKKSVRNWIFADMLLERIDSSLCRNPNESTLAYLQRVRQRIPSLDDNLIQRIAFLQESARHRGEVRLY